MSRRLHAATRQAVRRIAAGAGLPGAMRLAGAVLLACTLCACSGEHPAVSAPARTVGSDRDAHGCIGSAGYAWCAREGACVRSWELAKEKGFDLSDAGAFGQYCSGSDRR